MVAFYLAPAAAERPDVSYSLVAVDFLPPSVINATLTKVAGALSAGRITPLKHITRSLGTVATAFRQMIQASHVGKVVVSAGSTASSLAGGRGSFPTVAITGGSGGLGLMITAWLEARLGPLYIRLLSRGGRVTDAASLAAITAGSACVSCVMADAGVPADVAASLSPQQGSPLQAVLHAAGILQVKPKAAAAAAAVGAHICNGRS